MVKDIFKTTDGTELSLVIWDDVKDEGLFIQAEGLEKQNGGFNAEGRRPSDVKDEGLFIQAEGLEKQNGGFSAEGRRPSDSKVAAAKGVVQILHGMAEHIKRYDDFANFLNENGFIVAGADHRGHGQEAETKGTSEGDIAFDTARDAREITDYLIEKYSLPLVLLGHSYGSFLAQEYILQGTKKLAGVILSGSAYQGGLMTKLGLLMAKLASRKKPHHPGKLFYDMTFTAYDKRFKEGKSAWLNRNTDEVNKYNEDELCGFVCSNNFYKSMLKMANNLYKRDRLEGVDKNLRLLISSGDQDPVGNYGKSVIKLANMYTRLGLTNMELRLYNGARHEILNEVNKVEVYEDFLDFINSCL